METRPFWNGLPVSTLGELLAGEPDYGIKRHYISHKDGERSDLLMKFWDDLTEPDELELSGKKIKFTPPIEGKSFAIDSSRAFTFDKTLLAKSTKEALGLFRRFKDKEILAILQLSRGTSDIGENLLSAGTTTNSINNIKTLLSKESLKGGVVQSYKGDLPNGAIEIHSHGENLPDYHHAVSVGDIIAAIDGNPWVDDNGFIYKDLRVFGVVTVFKENLIQRLSLQIYKIDLNEMHKVIMSMEDHDPKNKSFKDLGITRWGTAIDL